MQKLGINEVNEAWKNVLSCWDYCQFTVHQGGFDSYVEALKHFNDARRGLRWDGLSCSSGYFKTVRGSRSIKQGKRFKELSY